jgi:hypothetical protein
LKGGFLLASGTTRSASVRQNRRLATCVAFSLALVSLFFLLQVVPHSHSGGHDEPNCRLCHAAHLGVAPTVSVTLLSLVLLLFGEILALLRLHFTEPFYAHSPSRAPPAPIA